MLVSKWSYAGTLTPPLGLAYVAAALEAAGHDVRIIDAVGEAPAQVTPVFGDHLVVGLRSDQIADAVPEDVDVIGVTCMFSSDWPYTRQVIDRLGQQHGDAWLIAGGEHVTAVPEQTLQDSPGLHCAALGEGEETVVELVEALLADRPLQQIEGLVYRGDDGGVEQTERRARVREIDSLPRPAWHLVPIATYMERRLGFGLDRGPAMPILASRGCPFQCTFCSSKSMWTTRWQARDPDLLLDEIEWAMETWGARNFDFYDLTAIVSRRWILAFIERIEERGLRFTWQLPSGTRSEAITADVVEGLARTGCVYLAYSPESGSPELLERARKRVDLEHMKDSMRAATRSGLLVKANMIMGLPSETRRDVAKSLRFIAWMARNGVSDVSIAPFAPYPGSELFADLDRESGGRLSTDAFYLELSAQTDLTRSYSWNPKLGAKELSALRTLGHALFYGIAVGKSPRRAVELAVNLATSNERTLLDKNLRLFLQRRRGN